MEDIGCNTVTVSQKNDGARKKGTSIHRKQRVKELRYGNHLNNLIDDFERPCNHDKKTLKCSAINNSDVLQARKKFFQVPNKIIQDRMLSHLILVTNPKREIGKYKSTARPQKHTKQVTYRIRKINGTLVKVCQKFFLTVFKISARRINTIAGLMLKGDDIKENRGGDHRSKSNETKKTGVENFIGKLQARESHYTRAKSKRLYLPSELSISKLWKLYNKENSHNSVNYAYFYKIFCQKFNIGFGNPASDTCSLCARLTNKLKRHKLENKPLVPLMTNLRIHKLRAKQFNMYMNENLENTLSFCFDMQQVQPLPKLPISEAYYLRQLSFYNLCITDLKCKHPIFYTWSENEASRGANEVASAIGDFLSELEIPEQMKNLRFFADGCAGQNKNCYVIHAMCFWLYHDAPPNIKNITIIFPVRGHSYMPADRVFGQVEKKYRKKSEILLKEDYENILSEIGEVRKLGTAWTLHDVKKLSDTYCKKLLGISTMKRIFIKKEITGKDKTVTVKVKMEENYRNEDESKVFTSIMKRGVQISKVEITPLPLTNKIKEEKLKNIKTLLNKFDEDWADDEKFTFYKELLAIIDNQKKQNDDQEEANSEEECDCYEDCGVKI